MEEVEEEVKRLLTLVVLVVLELSLFVIDLLIHLRQIVLFLLLVVIKCSLLEIARFISSLHPDHIISLYRH